MPGKRALLGPSLLALAGISLAGVVTCRHGFFPGRGGDGRLGFPESSGIVASRTHPGVFWTHADSGAPPTILAVTGSGETLAEVEVQGAGNRDWEDIAIDDEGFLYVGDIGNNSSARGDLAVYKLREPDPRAGDATIPVSAQIGFRYPDQTERPASVPNFDAEALFWARGRLYLLTKHRADTRTTLYRFPTSDGRALAVLEKVSEFDLGAGGSVGAMATAADLSPEHGTLAVLSYAAVFLFDPPAHGDDYLSAPRQRIELALATVRQCEAIAWDGEALVLTNEGGDVMRIDDARAPGRMRFPP